eukprot:s176_g28.t1
MIVLSCTGHLLLVQVLLLLGLVTWSRGTKDNSASGACGVKPRAPALGLAQNFLNSWVCLWSLGHAPSRFSRGTDVLANY